jgi:hypothetical protein
MQRRNMVAVIIGASSTFRSGDAVDLDPWSPESGKLERDPHGA